MRRRRRAASGPVGGTGGSFILDVILHLDSRHVKNKSWVYGSAIWAYKWVECHSVRTKPSKDRRITILGYAQASGPRRKHCYVNELLTHYTRWRRDATTTGEVRSRIVFIGVRFDHR